MNKDPYVVLGVSRSATDDEIKHAYRELAKKYHPDNYADTNLSELANEKMQEINEAYDEIKKEREGKSYGGSSYGGNSYGGSYSASGEYANVRTLINSGRYGEAETILDAVPAANRSAEWNFLKGCVLLRRGWYMDAQKYFDTACAMDPTNPEYRTARTQMRNRAQNFGGGYNTAGGGSSCSGCDVCSSLICADCCCECMGGDLIRCC